MSADAIILPARENCRAAILEASRMQREPHCRLYTDGKRLAWLPRQIPGWFRIGAADIRGPYEETDATASCCDIEGAA